MADYVKEFQGEYRFLSNFWAFDKPMIYRSTGGNIVFKNVESFFHAMKTTVHSERVACSNHPAVKKFSRTLTLRSNWDELRVKVMRFGLEYKFSKANPNLREKLLATGSMYLQEGNTWNDTFWGVDLHSGCGENILGEILMDIRKRISAGEM